MFRKYKLNLVSPVYWLMIDVIYFYRNIVFLSASVLGVLVMLSVYDEDVLTVEHVLSIITILGCVLAAARYYSFNLICANPPIL